MSGSKTYPAVPTVSVIMAARNADQTVAEALESVRSQTLADWEWAPLTMRAKIDDR